MERQNISEERGISKTDVSADHDNRMDEEDNRDNDDNIDNNNGDDNAMTLTDGTNKQPKVVSTNEPALGSKIGTEEEPGISTSQQIENIKVKREKKSKKTKPILSASEYNRITALLTTYLRQKEDLNGGENTIRWKELILWYLEREEADGKIQSEDQLKNTESLIDKVIKRLIEVDNILLVLETEEDQEENISASPSGEKKKKKKSSKDKRNSILMVHPNKDLTN